ncbi:MAG: 5-methyltetrahydropteroyltriglutamate--homocysteine S-methyltransferase [Gammaproteobacteria bacterium]|nr:5-methyltetrahydropteroyltriglutamate--homocysteine S-methyltransferase [Gammaproteobacteria bacterium]
MTTAHCLGFPRIGSNREYKTALESYWAGGISQQELLNRGAAIRRQSWQWQHAAGLDFVSVGDFACYDHILQWSVAIGVIPRRFTLKPEDNTLDLQFRMARGRAPTGQDAHACEMTKWFNTNYHYIVPELEKHQTFRLGDLWLRDQCLDAMALGYRPKPVIPGPLTYLYLAKGEFSAGFDDTKLELIPSLLIAYRQLLTCLSDAGVEWLQIDEPVLVMELPESWQGGFRWLYNNLRDLPVKLLLATYFDSLADNLSLAFNLPVAGIHVDQVAGSDSLETILSLLPEDKVLSLGVINGRNVWKGDLNPVLAQLQPVHAALGERLWIGSSCSLLHCPVDLQAETALDSELYAWLAFACQKLHEISLLRQALLDGEDAGVLAALKDNARANTARRESTRVHNPAVRARLTSLHSEDCSRQSSFAVRKKAQAEALHLPLFPVTTIGSFPQTTTIRGLRSAFRRGDLNADQYRQALSEEIATVIRKQEQAGVDVLVHGEPERNDMVEYFGELLDGFAVTANGWVQSYGSRCVKPPLLYGDVSRSAAMTVEWAKYAQSLTALPVKGMLTGPVTILCWSFVREDQPREQSCRQLALALRDEVQDLEDAGIGIIQIDEPALREGLPLKHGDWDAYLHWAVICFRISASGVQDRTQIHTHMCYAEFNDIIDEIAAMDADVITLEASRSGMEVLKVFEPNSAKEGDSSPQFNEFGPGVWDIHSPQIPSVEALVKLLRKAAARIDADRLWVNPDCGLKTRAWPETEAALKNLVAAAMQLRNEALSG